MRIGKNRANLSGLLRRTGVIAASLAMAAGMTVAFAPSAAAVTSRCDAGDMCWHYNSAQNGYNATYGRATNLASANPNVNGGTNYYFIADQWGSAGAGQNVWNNAGGARNRHTTRIMCSYVNSNYGGAQDAIGARTGRTLNFTYNNNASMAWCG
ncbi:hypothetical protein [Actinophytocola sediminis]